LWYDPVMVDLSLFFVLVAGAASPKHFDVAASFVPPAKPCAGGAIAVSFLARDPDVHINEEPAPRLKLDPEQSALVDKQPPPSKSVPVNDPEAARHLHLNNPVQLPVALPPTAATAAPTAQAN